MDGYLEKQFMKKGMLNLAKVLISLVTILLIGCEAGYEQPEIYYRKVSENIVGKAAYDSIYKKAYDSLQVWIQCKLGYYRFCGEAKYCYLDSLLCFNTDGNRFRGALLQQNILSDAVNDDIDYFYGEKINNQWYFFCCENLTVPRSMVKGHDPNKYLSYKQLHLIAFTDIFRGYIKGVGEINDEWVNANFENVGWGTFEDQASIDWVLKGKRFKTRKEFFEFMHWDKARENWAGFKKDSLINPQSKLSQ